MKKELDYYVRLYENFFDDGICDQTLQRLESADWEEHTFYNQKDNSYSENQNELSVSWSNFIEKEYMHKKLWFAVEQYILKDFEEFSWFNGWNGYTNLRFNRYTETTKMKLHCDHIHSMFDGERKGVPILSIVGSLNNDYEGGEFVMWQEKEIYMPKGSVLIFPSNFLFPHEVKPVTKGTRYTFVAWVW